MEFVLLRRNNNRFNVLRQHGVYIRVLRFVYVGVVIKYHAGNSESFAAVISQRVFWWCFSAQGKPDDFLTLRIILFFIVVTEA